MKRDTKQAWIKLGWWAHEITEWRSAGFTEAEVAMRWRDHGFAPRDALDWRLSTSFDMEEMSPDVARR